MKGWFAVALFGLLVSCAPELKNPVEVDSPGGILDLRPWDRESVPVIPTGWLWDPDVLWSPESGGRPADLPAPLAMGAPDKGGSFVRSLMQPRDPQSEGLPVRATAHLRVLADDSRSYGFQIGALPGAMDVWVNGHRVWQSGTLSTDPGRFRPQGLGTVLTVQPQAGVLDLVVNLVSTDPLVRHSELNRLWILGPATPMMANERAERTWRSLQVFFLAFGVVVFLWLSRLRPERKVLIFFALFLASCLVKMAVNVELVEPLFGTWFPDVPLSAYLFLNHGLNLLPVPFLLLFLVKQFPQDVSVRSLGVATGITALATVWELVPFVALAAGWEDWYTAIMGAHWSFLLNLYVILATVFIFERFYHLLMKGRPLSKSLFFGGTAMGLLVILPVPLSYFMAVKFTYFLGWGLFLFFFVLCWELVRLQVKTTEDDVRALAHQLQRRDSLAHFVGTGWADRLGKPAVEDLVPGDRRPTEALLVRLQVNGPAEQWLPATGEAAALRQALLVEWRDNSALWALDAWSETALAFALELRARLATGSAAWSVVLTRAVVEYRILDAGRQWILDVADVPRQRLDELGTAAVRFGAPVVLDVSAQDGLVIGGWRRHRRLTSTGREIELYEGEEEALAALKDASLDSFETALAHGRSGRIDEAVQTMFAVVQKNPFDQAARTHLADWGRFRAP